MNTGNKDLSLLFIDLAKAYDSIPHSFLWEKLAELGIDPKFITIIKSIYSNSTIKVIVNGHLTDSVNVEQGIKQGCILSPLLFTLYISGMGHMLEKGPLGCKIHQVTISALLYVDDLILIGHNRDSLISLLNETQHHLEWLGLNINCDKSNIMTADDIVDEPLHSCDGELLGTLKRNEIYKYLGVQVSMRKAHAMFKEANKKKHAQLNSIMGQILALANNLYAPITVGLALWNYCAIPALMHGIEIISLNKKDLMIWKLSNASLVLLS